MNEIVKSEKTEITAVGRGNQTLPMLQVANNNYFANNSTAIVGSRIASELYLMNGGEQALLNYAAALKCVKGYADVFRTDTPTLTSASKLTQGKTTAYLAGHIVAVYEFSNETCSGSQVAALTNLIAAEYGMLTLADFELFFRWFKAGRYEMFGKLSPAQITSALRSYQRERLEAAENKSYNEYLQTKSAPRDPATESNEMHAARLEHFTNEVLNQIKK